jgi:hypothetical protein
LPDDNAIADLTAATQRCLRALHDPLVDAFLTLWPDAAQPSRDPAPGTLPVLRWLGPACRARDAAAPDLLRLLVALSPGLAWAQSYTLADFGPGFLARYGWTELIGQRGPVASDRLAVGFLLLGPSVIYPSHSHAAEEVYLPLSGTAAWQRGAETWRDRAPGGPIHHASWMPHAMRTGAEPLLALYLWRGGDLTQKSRIG